MKILRCWGLILLSSLAFGQATLTNIDSALVVLGSSPNDTAKALLYQKVAAHYNVTALDSAKAFALNGIELSNELNYSQGQWMNLNVLGNYHERKTHFDSAMIYYNKALEVVDSTKSTKGFAVVLNNIATIHIRRGEYETALQYLFDALEAEEELGNRNGIAQAYNNIGVVYYYTQNFQQTTSYLTKALEIQEELGNYDGLINGYNNVGAIYDYLKQYDEAIGSYQKGLEIARSIGDKKMEATQLSNIAIAYSKKEDYARAEQLFMESIAIRDEIADDYGKANSYLGFGQMYLSSGNYSKARGYVNQALAIARDKDLKLIEREGIAALVELSEIAGDYQQANKLLKEYMTVKDTLLNRENTKTMLELDTKYQTAQKEKEILQQRAELAEKELQVKRRNNMLTGGLGLLLIFGLVAYLVYSRQRLKNIQLKKENELHAALAKIETQNKLQEQRLRISRDLHDNIGSQLTFIISSLDSLRMRTEKANEEAGKKISSISSFTRETIYELRDTIWAMNKNAITIEDLSARISNFIDKAQDAASGVTFGFNLTESCSGDEVFGSVKGMNVYRIIQEAVNNALKHAEAKHITVHFDRDVMGGTYRVRISDDGKGFKRPDELSSSGLLNMEKRAKEIDGTLRIDSTDEGTEVSLTFPE